MIERPTLVDGRPTAFSIRDRSPAPKEDRQLLPTVQLEPASQQPANARQGGLAESVSFFGKSEWETLHSLTELEMPGGRLRRFTWLFVARSVRTG